MYIFADKFDFENSKNLFRIVGYTAQHNFSTTLTPTIGTFPPLDGLKFKINKKIYFAVSRNIFQFIYHIPQ